MLKVYFKPDCATCRTALDIIHSNADETPELVEYLRETPSPEELREIIRMLGIEPEMLVRKKEPLYQEHYLGKQVSGEEWITILSENPVLIERPIIVSGDKAIIGRPLDKIAEFLKNTEDRR